MCISVFENNKTMQRHVGNLQQEAMNNSKFGSRPYDDKSRLSSQLRFFGAKKQSFISVYAKKPRVLVKAKGDRINVNLDKMRSEPMEYYLHRNEQSRQLLFNQGKAALYQQAMIHGAQAQAMVLGGQCYGSIGYGQANPFRGY